MDFCWKITFYSVINSRCKKYSATLRELFFCIFNFIDEFEDLLLLIYSHTNQMKDIRVEYIPANGFEIDKIYAFINQSVQ